MKLVLRARQSLQGGGRLMGAAGPPARRRKSHIMVFEGDWSSQVRDVRSVQPVMEALRAARVAEPARRHVNDDDDLLREMRRWGQAQHARYTIGYLALHGSPSCVYPGRDQVDLFDLAERLPRGALNGKILHIGSCEVLRMDDAERSDLRKALGVKVLCGFTAAVEWIPAMAFELLLFDAVSRYSRPGDAFNHLRRTYPDLVRELGFVVES